MKTYYFKICLGLESHCKKQDSYHQTQAMNMQFPVTSVNERVRESCWSNTWSPKSLLHWMNLNVWSSLGHPLQAVKKMNEKAQCHFCTSECLIDIEKCLAHSGN